MTKKTRPVADTDRESAQRDYRRVLAIYGTTPPANAKLRNRRREELRRIVAVGEECQRIDKQDAQGTLPAMPPLPVVFRAKSIYTDNVKPAPLPTRAEIEAHRRRLLGPKKS